MKSYKRFPLQSRRRGAVLVVAMICTLLTAVILGTLLRIAVTRLQQSRSEARAMQAAWLAESGIERAAAQLRLNPEYTGETWQIPATDLGGSSDGEVLIQISPVEGQANRRSISVRADYPPESEKRARKSKQVIITIPEKPPAPPEDNE